MSLFVVVVLYMVNIQYRDVQQNLNKIKNSGFILLMLLFMRFNEQFIDFISEEDRIQFLFGINIYLIFYFSYILLVRYLKFLYGVIFVFVQILGVFFF